MADATFHPNPVGNGLLPFCMRLRRTEGYPPPPPPRTHTLSIHFPDLLAKLGVFQGRLGVGPIGSFANPIHTDCRLLFDRFGHQTTLYVRKKYFFVRNGEKRTKLKL